MSQFFRLSFVLGSGILLLLSACSTRQTVVREGIKMPLNEAARIDYQQAEQFYLQGNFNQALPLFDRVQRNYSQTPYADNALWRMSQIFLKNEQKHSAVHSLKQLSEHYPDSDVGYRAYPQLGRILAEKGDTKASLEAYTAVLLSDLPAEERDSYAQLIAKKLGAHHYTEISLTWYLKHLSSNQLSLSRRAKMQQEVSSTILKTEDISALENFSSKEKVFPQGLIHNRLAQLYDRNENYARALTYLDDFFKRFPLHPYSSQAAVLRQNISGMTNKVGAGFDRNIKAKLGVLIPLSGPHGNYGIKIKQAIKLAKNSFLKRFPEGQIELVYIDSSQDGLQLEQQFRFLSQENYVLALIGPLFKGPSKVASQLAEKYRIPIISLSAAEGIADLGRFTFRNSITKLEQAKGLSYLCQKILKSKKVGILMAENSYAKEFASLFQTELKAKNIEVVSLAYYKSDLSNVTQSVRQLFKITPKEDRQSEICSKKESQKRENLALMGEEVNSCYPPNELPPVLSFDTLFIPDSSQRAKQILPTLAYYNVAGVNVLGPNLWNDKNAFENISHSILQGVMFVDGFYLEKETNLTQSFITAFGEAYGKQPGILEAQAFDTARLLFDTIAQKSVGSRGALMRALKNLNNYQGVSGLLSVQDNGEVRRKLTPLMIDEGKIVQLR